MPKCDVALVTLKNTVSTIEPIYVDTGNMLREVLGEYAELTALGLGVVKYHGIFPTIAKVTQEAHFYNLPEGYCNEAFDEHYDDTNMICAGQYDSAQDESSTCGGDSGGPLVSTDLNVLVGVSSWGTRRCRGGVDGKPSVFARCGETVKWFGPRVCNYFDGLNFINVLTGR